MDTHFQRARRASAAILEEPKDTSYGFQALLVLRVENSNPPDARVMTIWETEQALHESENNVYFYQALARALAFAKGFPIIREEEVMIHDFTKNRRGRFGFLISSHLKGQ